MLSRNKKIVQDDSSPIYEPLYFYALLSIIYWHLDITEFSQRGNYSQFDLGIYTITCSDQDFYLFKDDFTHE